ncbi:zinc finger CCCH domain-containing protein 62-like [Vicia villosa]|uniref:zinc finger CCCH domain-containing protein 62-like n=1 Tax=Vicia villosa TaxID=3911 RepID=UPI00273BEDCF|nr:zinc finger CCCH domain-containing protein 62-like isoform X2 [Vicia villosa]XP_058745629.1 zinc finger CCCH domain-containing protein 62-like [Vicia villosa]XP_058752514.1 zinc finger CCCH domain-containing protein 62-like [Vicia villosa]XP_058752516.1 zinc finger CCCH domain-containing protein 62-like [Vicia villosa]
MLYSGSKDQSIKVWDLDKFECKMTLNAHTGEVTSLICWDKFLLSGSSDCTIKTLLEKMKSVYTNVEGLPPDRIVESNCFSRAWYFGHG